MRGYFDLKPHPEDPDYLLFGNLGRDSFEPVQYAVHTFGDEPIGDRIAHDLIEHSAAHRTALWTSFEEEYRAIGASQFVRPELDMWTDVQSLLEYGKELSFNPSVKIPSWFEWMEEQLLEEEVEPEQAKTIIHLLDYGYWQKSIQFKDNRHEASSAFFFIKYEVEQVLRLHEMDHGLGLRCYFDTDKQIFRTKEKYYG